MKDSLSVSAKTIILGGFRIRHRLDTRLLSKPFVKRSQRVSYAGALLG